MNKIYNTCREEIKGFEDFQLNFYYAILADNNHGIVDYGKAYKHFMGKVLDGKNYFAITLKTTQQVIGYIYLNEKVLGSYEVGYLMLDGFQNCGYATEALDAICKDLEAHGVNYIIGNFKENGVKPFTLLADLNCFDIKDFKKIYSYSKD